MELRERTIKAAERALADHGYVSFMDVLSGMLLLHPAHVRAWHTGRMQHVDEALQAGAAKLRQVIATFQQWAQEQGLRLEDLPPHDSAMRTAPKHHEASQSPEFEKLFRMHYVRPHLPARRLARLRAKVIESARPAVFSIVKASKCGQCGVALEKHDLLTMQGTQPLCMRCAHLDHLVFLGMGDAALTRLATKYSGLSAVVVQFSRARKRYERQGVLVEPEALEKAARQARDT